MRWFVKWRNGTCLGGCSVDALTKEAAIAGVQKRLPSAKIYSAKLGNSP